MLVYSNKRLNLKDYLQQENIQTLAGLSEEGIILSDHSILFCSVTGNISITDSEGSELPIYNIGANDIKALYNFCNIL